MNAAVEKPLALMQNARQRDVAGHRSYVWSALLSIIGLGFWFFLGFPFGNHNESFEWVAIVRNLSFTERLTPGLDLSRTYRPLGQFVAMALYSLGGDRILLVQLFNFAVAAASLAILVCTSRNKKYAAAVAAVVGGTFFSGFIYLFHFHGVFYSPVLLMIVVVLKLFQGNAFGRLQTDVIAWFAAILAFLFHPYSLLIFCAMYAGAWLKRLQSDSTKPRRTEILLGILIVAASAVVTLWARETTTVTWSRQNVEAALACFRATEIHWLLSVVAVVLVFFTLADLMVGRSRSFYIAASVTTCAAPLFLLLGWPVVILWALACLGKSMVVRNWPLAGLIAVSLLLPAISPTGSPTYGIFAILACIAAMVTDCRLVFVTNASVSPRLACGLSFVAAILVVLLRTGVSVPVISRFAQPLLAEREKTYQLEEIVDWWRTSEYRGLRLTLYAPSNDPVHSPAGVASRRFRPPTYQVYLDAYTGSSAREEISDHKLILTFGGERIPGRSVHTVTGRFAGPARVYLSEAAPTQ